MTNLTKDIQKILERYPCIRECMNLNLVNHRALAKHIIQENKLDTTINAVICNLRRYRYKDINKIYINAHQIIGKIVAISTRSRLMSISLIKDGTTQQIIPKLFTIIHYNRGDIFRIAQAEESIKIIFDEKNFNNVEKIIPPNKIEGQDNNLAEINVHQHPDTKYTPGVMATIANDLAMNRINVIETISCIPEWIWIIEEKDLLNAYDVIYQLWQKFRKQYQIKDNLFGKDIKYN